MVNRAAWHNAVVEWVDGLYAECEATGSDPIYEFQVRDETRFVRLPPRSAASTPASVIAPAIAEPEYTGVVAATPQPVERAPEPSAPAAPPSAPQVAWTAGLIKSHLGIGYSNEVSRHLHRLELELALELMNDYGMTLDAKADQEWTSSKRMEKVDLQRKVIAHYDVLIADLEPGKVLGFGIKFIKWVDSVKNRKKRRKIADVWGLNP
jgi:hypothetical protein